MSSSSSSSRCNRYGFCDCGYKMYPRTSWTNKNPGRRFISCPNSDSRRKCGVYKFLDEELPSDYYKDLLYELHSNLESMKMKGNPEMFAEVGESRMEVIKLMEELSNKKSNLKIYEKICCCLLVALMCLCIVVGVVAF